METVEIFVPLDAMDEPLEPRVLHALGWSRDSRFELRVLRRSLDARKGHPLGLRMRVEVTREGEVSAPLPSDPPLAWPVGKPRPRVVIVGAGPAGSWAALRLAEVGVTATIVEQGKPVQPRRHDLANLQRGTLDPSSNYCFGEGGAGTYSDGKLYTRTKDRAQVAAVLGDLVRFGAKPDIAIDSRPHVGSNKLPKVLLALRAHLESLGVGYRFETAFSGLRTSGGRVRAVKLVGGDEIEADIVILAVGHSARAVYEWAAQADIAMERKPFALGVRIEHPQPTINRMQYGAASEHPRLPAAFYELKAQAQDRGVYSFCMCPGGWIVPAATEAGGVVVNGMSLSRRDSPFANSGLVVTVSPGDVGPDAAGVLAGVEYQRAVERAAAEAGGGALRAPGQRLLDFLAGRASADLPSTSYRPGVVPTALVRVLPPAIAAAMREGLETLCRRHPLYRDGRAVLIATESRTSSPVRLLRDPVTLASPGLDGLFPVGEGAGYAGGIVSAAIDGARAAISIVRSAAG